MTVADGVQVCELQVCKLQVANDNFTPSPPHLVTLSPCHPGVACFIYRKNASSG